jgi:hypothetical protein
MEGMMGIFQGENLIALFCATLLLQGHNFAEESEQIHAQRTRPLAERVKVVRQYREARLATPSQVNIYRFMDTSLRLLYDAEYNLKQTYQQEALTLASKDLKKDRAWAATTIGLAVETYKSGDFRDFSRWLTEKYPEEVGFKFYYMTCSAHHQSAWKNREAIASLARDIIRTPNVLPRYKISAGTTLFNISERRSEALEAIEVLESCYKLRINASQRSFLDRKISGIRRVLPAYKK